MPCQGYFPFIIKKKVIFVTFNVKYMQVKYLFVLVGGALTGHIFAYWFLLS